MRFSLTKILWNRGAGSCCPIWLVLFRWRTEKQGYNRVMKPLPVPEVPGKTEFERFDNAVRQVLTVSKDELLKREQREKKAPERKRRPKK